LGPIHAKISFMNANLFIVSPTGFMEGEVTLNGHKVKVGVFDSNLDGQYGGEIAKGEKDQFLIDLNGNGKFDTVGSALTTTSPEMLELGGLIQLADGKFWEPKVAPKGNRFSLLTDETPTGVLEFPGTQITRMSIKGTKGAVLTQPSGSQVVLPEGKYELISAEMTVKDDKGADWKYTISSYPYKKLDIVTGSTNTLAVGAPLKIDINVSVNGPKCGFDLGLTDASGIKASSLYDSTGKRVKEPNLVISDSSGKVLKTIPFSYG
jgi:hypothetical protein